MSGAKKRSNVVFTGANTQVSGVSSGSDVLLNNRSSNTIIRGLSFDSATTRSFEVTLNANILLNGGITLSETFTLEGTSTGSGWTMCISSYGDVTNVQLTIGTGASGNGLTEGQLYYTSPNHGSNYVSGSLVYAISQIANSNTMASTTMNTQGTLVLNGLTINSTEEVSGTTNGALYVAGGAKIMKNVKVGNIDATSIISNTSFGNITNLTLNNSSIAVINTCTATNWNLPIVFNVGTVNVNDSIFRIPVNLNTSNAARCEVKLALRVNTTGINIGLAGDANVNNPNTRVTLSESKRMEFRVGSANMIATNDNSIAIPNVERDIDLLITLSIMKPENTNSGFNFRYMVNMTSIYCYSGTGASRVNVTGHFQTTNTTTNGLTGIYFRNAAGSAIQWNGSWTTINYYK
jgi:hypothetical protein